MERNLKETSLKLVKDTLTETLKAYNELPAWLVFSKSTYGLETLPFFDFRKKADSWSVKEILEHVTITTERMIYVLDQQCEKVDKRIESGGRPKGFDKKQHELGVWANISKVEVILERNYKWTNPESHAPTGEIHWAESLFKLNEQFARLEKYIVRYQKGEGTFALRKFTLNDIGELPRLNVYEIILFIAFHAKRHIWEIHDLSYLYGEKVISRPNWGLGKKNKGK